MVPYSGPAYVSHPRYGQASEEAVNQGTTAREMLIPAQIGALQKAVQNLSDRIGSLEGRLQPVMSIAPPESLQDEGKLVRQLPDLGQQINDQRARIDSLATQVDSISRRLEL